MGIVAHELTYLNCPCPPPLVPPGLASSGSRQTEKWKMAIDIEQTRWMRAACQGLTLCGRTRRSFVGARLEGGVCLHTVLSK